MSLWILKGYAVQSSCQLLRSCCAFVSYLYVCKQALQSDVLLCQMLLSMFVLQLHLLNLLRRTLILCLQQQSALL